MPRLILLLAAAIVIYILYQRVQAKPPGQRRAAYIQLGLGAAAVVVLGLTLAGKMHWIGAALTGLLVAARQLLPTLIRFLPALGSLKGAAKSGSGQSRVETGILRMELDHGSGKLEGEVLSGPLAGSALSSLSREQLDDLLAYCRQQDAESEQLLHSYLQQRFGGDEQFAGASNPPPSGDMSRGEALNILGLDESADAEAITLAHRRLMQKLHPDRGGNDYLAAKINQAKDVLLS